MKSGSLTFGTTIIKTNEYVDLAKIAVKNGSSVTIAALEIEALDDLLVLIRQRSMLNAMRKTATGRIRKNSDFLSLVDKRVDRLLTDIQAL